MTLKRKFQGVMSLSAASLTLLQGASPANADVSNELADDPNKTLKNEINSKTDHLVIAPANQEKVLQLYAGHSSHASHASHYSSAGGGYIAPSPPAYVAPSPIYPSYPAYPVTPTPRTTPTPTPSISNTIPDTNSPPLTNQMATPVATNSDSALTLLKKAAGQGSASAQCLLGLSYLNGSNGAEKNIERAKILFELSALGGNAIAQKQLNQLAAEAQK